MVQHIDWEIAPENAPPQSESSRSVSGGLWDLSSTDARRHRQDVAIKRPLRTTRNPWSLRIMIQEFSGFKHFMDQRKVYHARMDGETSLKRKDALSL